MGVKRRRQKHSAAAIRTTERRTKAMALRKEGKTFEQIAAALGVSRAGAHKMVTHTHDALNALLVTETAELRQQQLDQIAALKSALWKAGMRAEVGKVDRLVKLFEREAKLAGLDAAEKYEHAGAGGGPIEVSDARGRISEEIRRLSEKLREGKGGG